MTSLRPSEIAKMISVAKGTARLVVALLVVVGGGMIGHGRCFAQDDAARYLQMAKAYADGMIQLGRDRYGDQHSPVFVSTLDLRTMKMPSSTSEPTRKMYSSFFRAEDYSTSANPMYHIDLYQLLEALTVLTDDPQYRNAARESIGWFFKNTQSPATGLMAWGEHLAWDLIEDKVTVGNMRDGQLQVSDIHEFYGPWLHWKTTCEVAPDAARRFAVGLWEHQIYDHRTCDYSRHARYSKHGPGRGYEFARQAGFYLDTWASVYRSTKDPELLIAVEKFLDAWQRRQNPDTGLLPFEGRSPDVVFVLHNLAFTVDGWEAAKKLPEPLASRLKTFIRSVDDAILKLKTDLSPGGKGFPKIADAHTGEVTNRAMAKARPGYSMEFINQRYSPYGGLWASVYGAGSYTDARHALLCYYRYRQIQRDEYQTLVLATAGRYVGSQPKPLAGTLTPKTLAPVMALLHAAWRLSRDDKYIVASRRLAEHARERLFEPGVAFPFASDRRDDYPYYASISYGDSLMLMFLELALILQDREDAVAVQCSIR
ncbi:MAG: hypothetical protein H8E44_24870 [Planctomycetes bacterium]|nr:hypothetical protein [Planctomycetota bacterium]MBL7037492.1 hypothetical protein [Pirellulaceae bacterium]